MAARVGDHHGGDMAIVRAGGRGQEQVVVVIWPE